MRTTLLLDHDLVSRAQALSGIREKTGVVHEGLRAGTSLARSVADAQAAAADDGPVAAAVASAFVAYGV